MIQGMLQKMLAQQEGQKVHERLERLELGTLVRARDTKCILFYDLEEEVG